MDNQNKIFDKFKEAAQNAETKDFPAMDKIWSRVEEKLDKKEDKMAISLWKKIAVAASLLLLVSLGYQFIKTDNTTNSIINDKVVTTGSEKNETVVSESPKIISKSKAEKILNNQLKLQQPVAINEVLGSATEAISYGTLPTIVEYDVFVAPIEIVSDYATEKDSIDKEIGYLGYSKANKNESYRTADSQISKKSSPLLIMNGRAISHSNDDKRDKMMQEELPNLAPENVESLVVLDEPLYIIDGNYYSENDLFGKNPKSPYAPLNKQEIKTITILQDTEATDKYGEKGKKGVVIITTRKGKPATQE